MLSCSAGVRVFGPCTLLYLERRLVGEGRGAVCHLQQCDAERPHVGLVVVHAVLWGGEVGVGVGVQVCARVVVGSCSKLSQVPYEETDGTGNQAGRASWCEGRRKGLAAPFTTLPLASPRPYPSPSLPPPSLLPPPPLVWFSLGWYLQYPLPIPSSPLPPPLPPPPSPPRLPPHLQHLGRHPAGGAGQRAPPHPPAPPGAAALHGGRHAQVAQPRRAVAAQQHVAGLDVAVDGALGGRELERWVGGGGVGWVGGWVGAVGAWGWGWGGVGLLSR